jgi:hypothetical protein
VEVFFLSNVIDLTIPGREADDIPGNDAQPVQLPDLFGSYSGTLS